MALRIELLDGHAGRDSFDCGVAALNDFLSRQAGQQQRKGLGKTYVALADGEDVIAGFVTVSVGQVAAPELPPHLKLPRYPVPILRIGLWRWIIGCKGRVSATICWRLLCIWRLIFPSVWVFMR